jgi:hypothetical protein
VNASWWRHPSAQAAMQPRPLDTIAKVTDDLWCARARGKACARTERHCETCTMLAMLTRTVSQERIVASGALARL